MKTIEKLLLCMGLCFFAFMGHIPSLYAQETEPQGGRESNFLVDFAVTFGEVLAINSVGNIAWRIGGPDSEVAFINTASIKENLRIPIWDWDMEGGQGGDLFLANQVFHPYAGGVYLASARSNNFNFYTSILASVLGSYTWETIAEVGSPASSDFVTTVVGGIGVGEMLHRIALEMDKSGRTIWKAIFSPSDAITAAVRGYGPQTGPSNIYDSAFFAGSSWMYSAFDEQAHRKTTWNQAALFFGTEFVYGNPFIQSSLTPFEHFELSLSLGLSVPIKYNFNFTSDGYLASWLIADSEKNRISNGISLHFDDYIIYRNLGMNKGTENISYNPNSLDYTLKWRRNLNNSAAFSLKFHVGLTPWAVTDYNGEIDKKDYNVYLYGANAKLSLELRQITESDWLAERETQGTVFALNLRVYDTWSIPNSPAAEFDMNVIFTDIEAKWVLPLSATYSLYIADHLSLLYDNIRTGETERMPDLLRWNNSAMLGVQISL
ncbi:DUF3943 domain-containing protein [Breznakiellaceae bacterium SP9]